MIVKCINAVIRALMAFALIIATFVSLFIVVGIASAIVTLPILAVFRWGLNPWIGAIIEMCIVGIWIVIYLKYADIQ